MPIHYVTLVRATMTIEVSLWHLHCEALSVVFFQSKNGPKICGLGVF